MSKENSIAIVTGAAGAIGSEICRTLLANNYMVIAQDKVAITIESENMHVIQCDLRDIVRDKNVNNDFLTRARAIINGNGLSLLVNNAATQILGGLETLEISQWDETIDVNLLAPFKLCQLFFDDLKSARGCVINISSIHASLTKKDFLAYSTSKAALSAMTRAMAIDVGNDIRVNAIEPAAIDTPMLREGFKDNKKGLEELRHFHPQNKIGTPLEVAQLVKAIASGDFEFLHGSCISLDGGIGAKLHDPI